MVVEHVDPEVSLTRINSSLDHERIALSIRVWHLWEIVTTDARAWDLASRSVSMEAWKYFDIKTLIVHSHIIETLFFVFVGIFTELSSSSELLVRPGNTCSNAGIHSMLLHDSKVTVLSRRGVVLHLCPITFALAFLFLCGSIEPMAMLMSYILPPLVG